MCYMLYSGMFDGSVKYYCTEESAVGTKILLILLIFNMENYSSNL